MWPFDLLFLGVLAATTVAEAPDAPLPDPTRPYQYSRAVDVSSIPDSAEAMEWRLTGLQFRDGVRRAILNGRLVKEGEQMGTATVTAIGATDVTLSVGNRLIIVRLLIPSIKHDVAAVRKTEPAGNK